MAYTGRNPQTNGISVWDGSTWVVNPNLTVSGLQRTTITAENGAALNLTTTHASSPGIIQIFPGTTTATTPGKNVLVTGGQGGVVAGNTAPGGGVTIKGGSGGSGVLNGSPGGDVILQGGKSQQTNSGEGGLITVKGGGPDAGGMVELTSGSTTSGGSSALIRLTGASFSSNGEILLNGITIENRLSIGGTFTIAGTAPYRILFSMGNSASADLLTAPVGSVLKKSAVGGLEYGLVPSVLYKTQTVTGDTSPTAASLQDFETTFLVTVGSLVTFTLPSPAPADGTRVNVKSATNSANINVTSAANIDGVSSKTITTAYGSLTLQSDGTNYWII